MVQYLQFRILKLPLFLRLSLCFFICDKGEGMNDVGFIFGPLLWGFWEIALWYQGGDGSKCEMTITFQSQMRVPATSKGWLLITLQRCKRRGPRRICDIYPAASKRSSPLETEHGTCKNRIEWTSDLFQGCKSWGIVLPIHCFCNWSFPGILARTSLVWGEQQFQGRHLFYSR